GYFDIGQSFNENGVDKIYLNEDLFNKFDDTKSSFDDSDDSDLNYQDIDSKLFKTLSVAFDYNADTRRDRGDDGDGDGDAGGYMYNVLSPPNPSENKSPTIPTSVDPSFVRRVDDTSPISSNLVDVLQNIKVGVPIH